MTKINVLFSAALLLAVAGCDGSITYEYRQERSEKDYQRAIEEKRAGHIDEAIKYFSDAIKASPGNASARFQLAVMLQESKKDYLGALCNYTEYLRIAGDSDKASTARDRKSICEKMLLAKLAAENGLSAEDKTLKELDATRAELEKAQGKVVELNAAAEKSQKRIMALERENASLSRMIKRFGGEDKEDDSSPARPRPVTTPVVVNEDDTAQERLSPVVTREPTENEKPITLNPEAKEIFESEESEDRSKGSDLLPQQPENPVVAPKPQPAEPSAFYKKPSMPVRPEFYVVQEGDTLSRIAKRFYGDRSKWHKIREANKNIVPMTGDIKAGMKLRLP